MLSLRTFKSAASLWICKDQYHARVTPQAKDKARKHKESAKKEQKKVRDH